MLNYFEDGTCLRYHDPRRFGAWLWIPKQSVVSEHPLLTHLAPEPLSDAFHAAYLQQALQHRKKAIKVCLMDQQLVVGVGNIYANEVLFQVGIQPTVQAHTLQAHHFEALVKAIKAILGRAIEQGGTTLKDFSKADGKPGYFQQVLRVYGRQGQACLACDTPITLMQLGQRATYFVRSVSLHKGYYDGERGKRSHQVITSYDLRFNPSLKITLPDLPERIASNPV